MKRLVNAITCTRFEIALILALAAPGSAWFWAAYGLGAVSDVLDGLRARRFGVQSDGGARLDSAADIAFLLALTAALLHARQSACWLLYAAGAVLLIRSVTYAAGFYKFRTFVSLYTTLNRAAGVVLVGYPVLAVLLGQGTAAWLAAGRRAFRTGRAGAGAARLNAGPRCAQPAMDRKTTALRSAPWFCVPGNSAADGLRVAGDDELFVRRDDVNGNSRIVG